MLELQEDNKLTTSHDPPIVFGSLDNELFRRFCYLMQLCRGLFQYAASHAPLRIEDVAAYIQSNNMELNYTLKCKVEAREIHHIRQGGYMG